MKNFLIGIGLMYAGVIAAFILKLEMTGNTWRILPIALICLGGLFQAGAYFRQHQAINEFDRKFKQSLK